MTIQRTARRIALMLVAASVSACGLLRAKPTPLPWIPTSSPPPSVAPQIAATASPPAARPTQTSLPSDPTVTPTDPPTLNPTPTQTPPVQAIILEAPAPGQIVANPIEIRGQAEVLPFEGTLVIRVVDQTGQVVAEMPIVATGTFGEPATFEATVTYGGMPGPGYIEILDYSARDGSVIAEAIVEVALSGFSGGGYVELPAPSTDVTLPIKLLARVGTPGQNVNVTVSWDDGTRFAHTFQTLAGLDGRGLLIVPLDFVGPDFNHPGTQDGAVQIHTLEGSPLAWQPVRILAPSDPNTMSTVVHWVKGETIVAQTIRIPRTLGIGRASLEALLWGPVPQNSQGYTTMIPNPEQILAYPGRGATWGERPQLRNLTIEAGTAYADFSLELGAHAGGALQTTLIRQQIEATLKQFATVNDVVISINGVTGVLEP